MKKKNIVMFSLIFIIILGVIILCYYIYNNPNEKGKSNNSIKDQIIELLDNSYKYYLLKEGHINLGEDVISINGEDYYLVNEEWLKNFKDINDLVFNTFSKVRAIDLYNDIVEKQEMTIIDNELYIKLSKESCNLDYQINNRDFSYTIEDGALLIDLKYLKIYAYEEEGKWKLDVNPYDCQFNVNN